MGAVVARRGGGGGLAALAMENNAAATVGDRWGQGPRHQHRNNKRGRSPPASSLSSSSSLRKRMLQYEQDPEDVTAGVPEDLGEDEELLAEAVEELAEIVDQMEEPEAALSMEELAEAAEEIIEEAEEEEAPEDEYSQEEFGEKGEEEGAEAPEVPGEELAAAYPYDYQTAPVDEQIEGAAVDPLNETALPGLDDAPPPGEGMPWTPPQGDLTPGPDDTLPPGEEEGSTSTASWKPGDGAEGLPVYDPAADPAAPEGWEPPAPPGGEEGGWPTYNDPAEAVPPPPGGEGEDALPAYNATDSEYEGGEGTEYGEGGEGGEGEEEGGYGDDEEEGGEDEGEANYGESTSEGTSESSGDNDDNSEGEGEDYEGEPLTYGETPTPSATSPDGYSSGSNTPLPSPYSTTYPPTYPPTYSGDDDSQDWDWGKSPWGGGRPTGPTRDPTDRPTVEYVPMEGDPLVEEEEEGGGYDSKGGEKADPAAFDDSVLYHGLGGTVGAYLDGVESPQELERDPNVQLIAGILGGLFLVALLVTAHLVMNHPDGLCAGCCRLTLKIICCFFRTLCLPCRAMCCKGGDQSQGRRTHAPMRTPFPSDLELA